MIAPLQTVLRKAQKGKYAVGAFNVSDLEQAQAVISAAVTLRSPVIVNTSPKAIEYAGLEEITALVMAMAKKTTIPIVLNLDHGRDAAASKRCVDVGYSGIMYDGSRFPYATNVKKTAEVVAYAHHRGVGVEGELGAVEYRGERVSAEAAAETDPKQAVDFVRRTKVDAFAVAIGNSHGLPRPHERLNFGRLQQIQTVVRVPLVLHGASGTPAKSIQRAIRLGIAKINIDTDLRLAYTGAVRTYLRKNRSAFDPREYLTFARQAVIETVKRDLILFQSRGKAR